MFKRLFVFTLLPALFILAGCGMTTPISEDSIIETDDSEVQQVAGRDCSTDWYYANITWSQIYSYEYDAINSARIAEIPELCIKVIQVEQEYEDEAVNLVRDTFRTAWILRTGNTLEQNKINDQTIELLSIHPDKTLQFDAHAKLVIADIDPSHKEDDVQAWRQDNYGDHCILSSVELIKSDIVNGEDRIVQYNGTSTNNEDIDSFACPSIYSYEWESRMIIPLDYPQGVYEFFAPSLEFTDR